MRESNFIDFVLKKKILEQTNVGTSTRGRIETNPLKFASG